MQAPRNLRAAWAEIDLDALRSNAARLAELADGRPIRVVLKADAYGHGAAEVARALAEEGVDRFAVALVEEGVELRRAGISGDVLVMGTCREGQCPSVMSHRLVPTVSSLGQLDMWCRQADGSADTHQVHLKLNTGMNRLGLSRDELGSALDRVRSHPRLELAGLMSHLAEADLPHSPRTKEQNTAFAAGREMLTDDEQGSIELHMANSAGLLHHDVGAANVVRPGLAVFGYDPTGAAAALHPVMAVKARIVQMHDLATGERVGYGGRWQATRPSRVGTVPLGYADGYPLQLGGRAEALVGGRRVPVIGAVSMDMLALDLTGTDHGEGVEVVLLGRQGSEIITAHELAERADTLVYDVLCGLGLRLPKLSVSGGDAVAVYCRFEARTPA